MLELAIASWLAGAAVVAFVVACLVGWAYLQLLSAYGRLRMAAASVYLGAHWIPASNPDMAPELWSELRDAAGLPSGLAPHATTAIVGTQLEWPAGVSVRADLGGDLVGVIVPTAAAVPGQDEFCIMTIVHKGQPLLRIGCENFAAAQDIYLQHLASIALNAAAAQTDLQQKSDSV